MTVVDASVLVDALVVAGAEGDGARGVLREVTVLHVPSIFAAEATSAVRALHSRGNVSLEVARGALVKIKTVRTVQYPFEPFLDRVWELRDNLSVHDGWYVALAESLDTGLVTADRRLADAPGPRCVVTTVAQYVRDPGVPPVQRTREHGRSY
ncbi:MAG: type II toxin-antitoxin system VapC family toxin [Pseudonocardiaceae bacterium]